MVFGVIILIVLTSSLAWGISRWFENIKTINTVKVGVSVPGDSGQTRLIVDLLSGMESVRSICSFEFVDSEEMIKGLKEGNYQVAVELPEDFYDDVNTGVNTPLSVYFAADEDMSKSVFKELLHSGLNFTRYTEASIYSVVELGNEHKLKMSVYETEYFLSEFYLMQIFKRSETFNSIVLSATGEIEFGQYYYIVGVLFFLLLGSLMFGFQYREEDNEVLRALTVRGISPFIISLSRLLVISIYAYAVMAISYMAGCFLCRMIGSNMMMFDGMTLLLMIPISLAMSSFTHLIYTIAKSRTLGTIILMGANLVMLILSGGILPIAFLTKPLSLIGEWLPLNFWLLHFQRYLFGGRVGSAVLGDIFFFIIIFTISTFITSYKLVRTVNICGFKNKSVTGNGVR